MQQKTKQLTHIQHPLIAHKLTLMRDKHTPSKLFRELCKEITTLMMFEVSQNFPLCPREIETPLEGMVGEQISGKKLALVSILRAGNGMLDGVLSVLPNAKIGVIGINRNHETLAAYEYYFKMPTHLNEREVLIVDPMLATGNSAVAAIGRIKEYSPKKISLMCLLSCPHGIAALHEAHPDVHVYTAAVDRELNAKAYILPGLGDAGDRLFGTI